ncbi:ER degradation-enhancing alpha-mannosidase-like protein 2 isoform X1 [Schistocerca gregaria]|uniref:ER degradation-enhancing alpha-mannosidase-like protein 2 isoform X1 n=2 Tax=Schistocerca gregaria TaxID=7010 RepID=UPI00211F40BA|nr:ER degradation-enhancing alpha-mannosidase-like protein 2 isoform X1 [Schistocerca gregaria]
MSHVKYIVSGIYLCFTILLTADSVVSLRNYEKKDLEVLREEVRQMFQHAYDSYLRYAYPYDELRPLSCDGMDTWGSYSLTLIDALDTLAVMGNYTEFQRVVNIVTTHANFDANINVSVFETNIRIIGGLLSAHLLSYRAGVPVEPGWPCNGPLLHLAEDMARRLLAAFDTATGMPYGTVNLRYGVPPGETSVTCTAGVGTFILEMGTLSRLTGDPVFEEVAMNALHALYNHRSAIGLVGNHIDVQTGKWTAQDAGIGAGVDSYYEYLAKGAILLQRPELMRMFQEGRSAIDKYLSRDDWHLWVSMSKGQVTLPVFQSLEAYWPGVLSLIGEVSKGMKSLHNYHQVWKQYGFTPEFYNIPQGEVGTNREGYPLRPELVESVMYLYRATRDPYLIEVGKDILRSIQHSARTPCGYATIKDVRDHRKEDRMESFFLAETTKYLYLLFDPDNFIHNRGDKGTIVQTPWGECVLEAGGYIFNTEAHPIDPGALHCCSGHRESDIRHMLSNIDSRNFRGERLSTIRNLRKKHQSYLKTENSTQQTEQSTTENTDSNSGTDDDQRTEAKNNEEVTNTVRDGSLNEVNRSSDNSVVITDDADTQYIAVDGNETNSSESYIRPDNSSESVNISDQDNFDNFSITTGTVNMSSNGGLELSSSSEEDKSTRNHNSALEYRADDSDHVYAVRDTSKAKKVVQSGPVGVVDSEKAGVKMVPTWHGVKEVKQIFSSDISSALKDFLLPGVPPKRDFDPQILLERLRSEINYPRNISWESDYEVLSCLAQPFVQRISMSGEIFGAE